MTDQDIDKAAAFLLTLRPPRTGVPAALQHAEAVVEIRVHLQIMQALKMAGLVGSEHLAIDPAPPAEEILTCAAPGCGWAGHADERQEIPGTERWIKICPACGGEDFEAAA